jgi:diguanylate cyclase (GGDEF)-like protein/PAS domain S-box-containing protein
MLTSHLSLAAITSQDWDRWWPVVATVATAVVLVGYLAYRYALVWQQLCQTKAVWEAERRRLNATLESLFDPHAVLQPVRNEAGRIVDFLFNDANPAACGWIGVDRDHLKASRLIQLYPSVETSGLLKILADTADTGHPAAVDAFAFPLGAAGFRWIDIRAVRVDERVSFTWRDVTDRDAVTKKLAASEEQFRLLAENSSDVVVRVGADGKIIWVSPAVTPVLGWAQEDWIGHMATDFFSSSADRERFLDEQQKAMMGQSILLRTQMQAKGDAIHWVEIHAGPYRTEEGRIDGIAASFRLVDAEVSSQRILERRARTDELTNLLNRKEVIERIETLNKHDGRRIAVLWCDIDRFKVVNDTYGHAAGDTVLKTLADRIRGGLRSTEDIGARIGGDELLVLLNGVRDLQDAVDVAEKLRRSAAEPIPTAAGPISITLSIGVTLADPEESTDALIARADDAMYQAKKSGRNQVVAFEPAAAAGGRQDGGSRG